MTIATIGIDLAKNDAADAAAICEAVTRPNMRFVPGKTLVQRGQLAAAPCPPAHCKQCPFNHE